MEFAMFGARHSRALNFQACCRGLSTSFSKVAISSTQKSHMSGLAKKPSALQQVQKTVNRLQLARNFSMTTTRPDWLRPKSPESSPSRVGRPRMPTGGSSRGTTLVWGEYGLRMTDHDRRVSAKQFQIAQDTIRKRLRGLNYKLYARVSANIGVYTSGNEVRMGKGKGKFDYWAARVPVNRVIFEITGDVHEKVVRDAFRLAGHKLPGLYEFVKKGDPPIVGLTKLQNGITLESLKRARREPAPSSVMNGPITGPATTDAPSKTMSPPP